MLILAYCADSADAVSLRSQVQDAHRAHLGRNMGCLKLAALLAPEPGPAFARETDASAAVLVIEAEDRAAAKAMMAEDPYFKEGVWQRVDLYDVAAFHGVWSPDYERALKEALENYPVDDVLPELPAGRTYAMFATFNQPFEPTPEQVLGHKQVGSRMSKRLMAALPMVYGESIGASVPDRPWQLLCVLRAENVGVANRMYHEDPLASDGLMEATMFAMPAVAGGWLATS